MSDSLTRGFRAQLNTAMESVLSRAVYDIMMIYESSLNDHQLELARRGEEVANLKMKLQTVELKLAENTHRGAEMNVTQKEPGDVKAFTQTEDEVSTGEPDDWCAPLGDEAMFKQDDDDDDDDDDDVCPSVRLRQLWIPLHRVPLIKQEVTCHSRGSHKRRNDPRRSLRDKSQSHTLETGDNQRKQHVSLRYNMRGFPPNNFEQTVSSSVRRRRSRRHSGQLTRKNKNNMVKREIPSKTKEQTTEKDCEKKYTCKFCTLEFDTPFGRSVHTRSHKTCRGCRKDFASPSMLECHWKNCKKFQILLAKKMQNTNAPQPQPLGGERQTRSGKNLGTSKEHSSTPSDNQSTLFLKKYSCSICAGRFRSKLRLTEHIRIHTGEKPYCCSMCPKKYRIENSLIQHVLLKHQGPEMSVETNIDLKWTSPLEDIVDDPEPKTISRKDIQEMDIPGDA